MINFPFAWQIVGWIPLAAPLVQQDPSLNRLANGLVFLLAAGLIILCLTAFIVALSALLPQVSRRSQTALERTPWRAFFIGLANYLFLGGIALVLFSVEVEILGLFGLLITTFLIVVTFLGLPGFARLTGERLTALHDDELSALRQLLWGALTIELAALLPFLGWFVLTPVLMMISFGGVVLGWRSRGQTDLTMNRYD